MSTTEQREFVLLEVPKTRPQAEETCAKLQKLIQDPLTPTDHAEAYKWQLRLVYMQLAGFGGKFAL